MLGELWNSQGLVLLATGKLGKLKQVKKLCVMDPPVRTGFPIVLSVLNSLPSSLPPFRFYSLPSVLLRGFHQIVLIALEFVIFLSHPPGRIYKNRSDLSFSLL